VASRHRGPEAQLRLLGARAKSTLEFDRSASHLM
jgi:hypothetical protein